MNRRPAQSSLEVETWKESGHGSATLLFFINPRKRGNEFFRRKPEFCCSNEGRKTLRKKVVERETVIGCLDKNELPIFFLTISETGDTHRNDEGDLKVSESFWSPTAHLTTKLGTKVQSLFFKNPCAVTV